MEWFKCGGVSDRTNSGSQGFAFNVAVTELRDINRACNLLPISVSRDCRLKMEIPEDHAFRDEGVLSDGLLFDWLRNKQYKLFSAR